MARPSWLILLILLGVPLAARAQSVSITSPFDGHSRADRFIPVHVSADGLTGPTLRLSAADVLPAELPVVGGRVDAVVPLLPTKSDPPTSVDWSCGAKAGNATIALRPLKTDDRLILTAGDDDGTTELAAALFPRRSAVFVKLDTSRPKLLWPAAAFTAADAVALDPAAAARLDESHLRTLLAAGVAVAIRTPDKPPGPWPWKQDGAWWVLQHDVGGIRSAMSTEAYDPSYLMDRTRPYATRRTALLAAAAWAIVVLAAALWRGRVGYVLAVVACVGGAGAAIWASRSLPAGIANGGDVVVWDGQLAQRDRWTYVRGRAGAKGTVAIGGLSRPVFYGSRAIPAAGAGGGSDVAVSLPGGNDGQAAFVERFVDDAIERPALKLVCDADGAPAAWAFDLPAGQTLAFVSRAVTPDAPPAVERPPPAKSPVGMLAERFYPGDTTGEASPAADAPAGWWATVVNVRK